MSATSGRLNSGGGRSPGAQHVAHLRAGERDAVLLAVGARLRRRHALAPVAPEGVLEVQRRDAQLAGRELVEDLLRVVRAVVVADAGVVATDDEVRAAVVLAADRVQDRLASARRSASRRGTRSASRGPSGSSPRTAPRSSASARRRGRRRPSSRRRAGARSRPSTISSAHFWMYSCARWIGLRVWNPTTVFQPRSANAARVSAGVSRYCDEVVVGGSASTWSVAGDALVAGGVAPPRRPGAPGRPCGRPTPPPSPCRGGRSR